MKYRQAKKLLKKCRREYKTEAQIPTTDGKRLDVSVAIRTVYPPRYAYAAVRKAASHKFQVNFPRYLKSSLGEPSGITTTCVKALEKYFPTLEVTK